MPVSSSAHGTWIGLHVVVDGPTTIGRDNKIFQFASIGAAPQDLKYNNEPTRLEIGDRNTFRENTTINRGTTKDQLVTRIGSDNLFMTGSHRRPRLRHRLRTACWRTTARSAVT